MGCLSLLDDHELWHSISLKPLFLLKSENLVFLPVCLNDTKYSTGMTCKNAIFYLRKVRTEHITKTLSIVNFLNNMQLIFSQKIFQINFQQYFMQAYCVIYFKQHFMFYNVLEAGKDNFMKISIKSKF